MYYSLIVNTDDMNSTEWNEWNLDAKASALSGFIGRDETDPYPHYIFNSQEVRGQLEQ